MISFLFEYLSLLVLDEFKNKYLIFITKFLVGMIVFFVIFSFKKTCFCFLKRGKGTSCLSINENCFMKKLIPRFYSCVSFFISAIPRHVIMPNKDTNKRETKRMETTIPKLLEYFFSFEES